MPNVLIVEDNLMIADMLQEVLEASGYQVVGIARGVDEALRLAGQAPLDFAVIDIQLADDGDGVDVGTELRKKSSTGILFSTGSEHTPLTTRCGDAVMVKPYRLGDVARGLQIIRDMANQGYTTLDYPRSFRLLALEAV